MNNEKISKTTLDNEDYLEYLEKYGREYLDDKRLYDYLTYSMDDFDELNRDVTLTEVVEEVLDGYEYSSEERKDKRKFNLNDEYFAYDGIGVLISIPDFELAEYYKSKINKEHFIDWLNESGLLNEGSLN